MDPALDESCPCLIRRLKVKNKTVVNSRPLNLFSPCNFNCKLYWNKSPAQCKPTLLAVSRPAAEKNRVLSGYKEMRSRSFRIPLKISTEGETQIYQYSPEGKVQSK